MIITIVLLHQDMLYYSKIESGQTVTFGSHKKDTIKVPDFSSEQISVKWKKSGLSINAKKAYSFEENMPKLDTILVLDKGTRTALFLSTLYSEEVPSYSLPYHASLKVGRDRTNDIEINLPFISGYHFTLKNESDYVRVEDMGSTNGLYLNGKKIVVSKMKSGDELSILGIRIRLENGVLYFHNVGDALRIHVGGADDEAMQSHTAGQFECLHYKRSPRMMSQLPSEEIILAPPPAKGQKYEKRSGGIFASLAGQGAMMATSMLTTAASPALIAARAASLISPVTSMASASSAGKKRKESLEQYETTRRGKYSAYIEDQKARILKVADEQRSIIAAENPEPRESINVLYGLRRALWERMPSDRDFLDVRMGMGYEDLCVNIRSRGGEGVVMDEDEMQKLTTQIVEETRIVDNVPARLRLLQHNTIGFVGNRQKTIQLIRNMLISLTTSHCFEDVRIAGIFSPEERKEWESLRWLPHFWDNENGARFLAFDQKNAHEICDHFNKILKDREEQLKSYSGSRGPLIPRPFYILIFGDSAMVEKEEIMNHLFSNKTEMGITSLFLYNNSYDLPKECEFVVDLDDGPSAYRYKDSKNKSIFTLDPPISIGQFDSFARRVSAIQLDGFTADGGLPDGITFLEGYGVRTVEELNVWERWQSANVAKSLAVPIGIKAGGKPFLFDIHEKAHGAHGLVAGTTGSGKSETILSWILSMAVNYHPYEVSFVIIDYKGGGMANLVDPLPHVVGKITNIDSNIGRSLVSLVSENKRREEIFTEYGVNHIDQYMELYRSGKAKMPLPHLIIVSDEFAELKKSEPEFMAGLVQVARIGRSLGVHLVLATQKPGGLVDEQINSNSKFRICLKVATPADSREMLNRPDAASIRKAGRAFIRVGADDYYEQFQSYWSGAPYYGNAERKDPDSEGNLVRIVEMNGNRIRPVTSTKKEKKAKMDEIRAAVAHIADVAKAHNIEKLDGPWKPELPELLHLQTLQPETAFDGTQWKKGQKWLSVPVGMYDLPKEQAQGIQVIDFAGEGHYGIYGAPGTGKTTFLKSVVLSLGLHYTPDDVNIYILDCGGWSMSNFSEMPHVGGVALDREEEKFTKLEKLLMDEFEDRKKKFLRNAVSSLKAYRESVSPDMPAIILVIDNIVPIFDNYPDMENFFVTLSREGATYGFYLIYTANSTTGVRYKVVQNIRGAVAFELTDRGDYAGIVGKLDTMKPPVLQGRALYKNTPPLEFQAAMYIEGETDREKNETLKRIIAQMNAAWSGKRPKPIPVMPETITLDRMKAEYKCRTLLPVGINHENIETAFVDLTDNYSLLVSGSMRSGKSAMLRDFFRIITEGNTDTKTYVFDSAAKSLESLKTNAHRYAVTSDDATVSSMLAELVDHLNVRKRAQNQARQEQGGELDENQFIAGYELLCIFVDDIKDFVDTVSDASKNSMERICRLAQNLGVIFICAGRVADVSKYNEIESLTRVIVANQNGVTTGGSPAQYTFFQNNLKYNERETDAGEGSGIFYQNGKCLKFKKINETN